MKYFLPFLIVTLGLNYFAISQSLNDLTMAFGKSDRTDSVQSGVKNKLDTLGRGTQLSDTLKSDLAGFNHKLDSVNGKVARLPNALQPELSKYNHKLDSVKGKLTHRIDSLERLNLPASAYKYLLDSINKSGPVKDIKMAEAKLASLEKKIDQPITKLNADFNRVQSQVNQIQNEAGPGGNLPGNAKLPNLQVPGLNPSLPNTSAGLPQGSIPGINALPNTNLTTPQGSLPGTASPLGPGVGVPGVGTEMSKVNGEMKSITNAPQKELGQLKNEVPLGQVQSELGQVKGYSKDLKNLSKGNLDSMTTINKAAEKEVVKLADMKGLQGGASEVNQYKAMAAKGNDPEAMKKLAMQEVQKQAIDHFAGKEKELQAAMSQLGNLKKKYSNVSSLSDLKNLSRNRMHGKPLIERIVPGINFQFQIKNKLLLDFNQQAGYRITGRLMAGAGWNERIAFKHFTQQDRIYGPRTFVEFKFTDNFGVRADLEKMNTYVLSFTSGMNDPGGRQWKWGLFLGLKKEYKFTKYVKGNIQTMYNFLDRRYNESPYADRINVRMGFEFPMKKQPDSK